MSAWSLDSTLQYSGIILIYLIMNISALATVLVDLHAWRKRKKSISEEKSTYIVNKIVLKNGKFMSDLF